MYTWEIQGEIWIWEKTDRKYRKPDLLSRLLILFLWQIRGVPSFPFELHKALLMVQLISSLLEHGHSVLGTVFTLAPSCLMEGVALHCWCSATVILPPCYRCAS